MIDDYSKKDMKPTEMQAPKPSTMAKELAETGLEKVSGNS